LLAVALTDQTLLRVQSTANERGKAVISIEVVIGTPSLRTALVRKADANDSDLEVFCGEI
jgi:hypothetical protein